MTGTERTMWQTLAECATERPQDRRNSWIANGLILLWALSYVVVSQLVQREIVGPGLPTYLVSAFPVAVSVLAIAAYIRFLTHADELLRKMALEALALGFGGGFVATCALDLAEKAGFGPFDIGAPLMVMIICWVVGFVNAARRYS